MEHKNNLFLGSYSENRRQLSWLICKDTFKMAAGRGGVQRVLQKLDKSIEEGNYYESHQMIRTLYFRLVWIQVYSIC